MRFVRHLAAILAAITVMLAPCAAPAFPINSPLGRIILHKASSCDAAGAAAVAAMTTAPDANQKAAYCAFIASLEATGTWAKLDRMQLLSSHSVQSSQLNLARPTDAICTEAGSGALTYVTNGYVSTDGSRYLTCGSLLPSGAHYSQNDAVAGVFTDATVVGYRMGVQSGNYVQMRVANTTSVQGHINGSSTSTQTLSTSSTGWRHFIANRSSSASFTTTTYSTTALSGGQISTTDASSAISGSTFYIFHSSTSNAASGAKIYAVYTGSSFTATDMDAMHAALVTYLQTIGAI